MFRKIFKKKESVRAIGTGVLKSLNDVPDEMFASKMLGDGFALDLTEGTVYAPISGELVSMFPTGHAYGIKNDELEVLVHLGIDTVEVGLKAFDVKVKQGDYVQQGDVLAIMDLEYLKEHDYHTISPVILTSGQRVTLKKENQSVTKDTEEIMSYK